MRFSFVHDRREVIQHLDKRRDGSRKAAFELTSLAYRVQRRQSPMPVMCFPPRFLRAQGFAQAALGLSNKKPTWRRVCLTRPLARF